MPEASHSPARVTALIADDDPGLLTLLEMSFRAAGYDITAARDGATAVTAVKERRFRLLILDILMPGATGWEVLEEAIAATPPGEPLPRAILITGFNQEYVVDFSVLQKEGVGGMMLKPFSPAALLEEAARILTGPAKMARVVTKDPEPAR